MPDLSDFAPTPAPAQGPIFRPTARFMLAHPAHFIALGLGSGLSPVAPGTAGTLWAWLSFLVLQPWLSTVQTGLLIGAAMLLGWWACTVTAQHMQVADSGHIVWDEIAAFWLVLWLVLPAGLGAQLAAFLIFRAFDAIKVGPMAWADQRFKGFGPRGGFGIMFDDVLAAFCTLLVIAAWTFFWRAA
jgi:phosphatidylglycerophosphatase A